MEKDDKTFNSLLKYTNVLSVALDYRDHLTQLHSERVRALCTAMGEYCDLSHSEINNLIIAASFHDIGKIGISDKILLNPSKLDESEWAVMKQHSEIGERIMLSTELEGAQHAAQIIRHHHEHYNGMGYPDQLSGDSIPICSRIITIVDSYDAMAMTRTYHQARTHPEIMAIMHEETGVKHDPELMHIFCDIIESSDFKAIRL